jgi:hypothetical protein
MSALVWWLASILVAFVLVVWALRRALRSVGGISRSSVAGAACWWALLVAWLVFSTAGNVDLETVSPAPCALLTDALALAGAASLAGPRVRERLAGASSLLRPVMVVVGVPVAFFLMEWPYNAKLFSMEASVVALNLFLVALVLVGAWFVGQRRRGTLVFIELVAFVWGVANYYLTVFKGATVLPADVAALGTAFDVRTNYDFVLFSAAPIVAAAVFALFGALCCVVPNRTLHRRGVAVNLVVGLGLWALLGTWYRTRDISDDYGVSVDVWDSWGSYEQYGSLPSFLQRLQEVEPRVPDGYSAKDTAALEAELAAAWDEEHPDYPQTLEEARAYALATTGSDELPSVVAVMNESFSDLSIYPNVEGYDGLPDYDAVDAAARGTLYVSARGGGTCNSEFEYLTGSSMGGLGGGVYAYMFYDLSGVDALPRHLSDLGYATYAVHPAAASNWRRDTVYRQLGFSEFLSEEAFEGADTLRDLVTDRATYDAVLDLLNSADASDPVFVFDVTLQNHGGYETGLLAGNQYEGVTVSGEHIDGMDEYLASVDAAQDDLTYLLDELAQLDRKVLLVFFGDHQPGFNDEVSVAAYQTELEDETLAQVQERFSTTYFVWANYDLGDWSLDGGDDMSAGYLMAQTLYAAGLPLNDHQKALLELYEQMPAFNLNGYCDADGTWYWNGQDSDTDAARRAYMCIQYAELFG